MVDLAKLDHIIEIIEQQPAKWDQRNWGLKTSCGTSYCVAGWAGMVDRAVMDWQPCAARCGETCIHDRWLDTIDGEYPADYAQESLGLDDVEADALFHENNSLADIKRIRDRLANGPS